MSGASCRVLCSALPVMPCEIMHFMQNKTINVDEMLLTERRHSAALRHRQHVQNCYTKIKRVQASTST
jgi:hypothetical protein